MEKEIRQVAYKILIKLADEQGYVTFDNIMDCADEHFLSIQDFDWLSNSITSHGILVYDEVPKTISTLADDDDYYDFAQSDYELVYRRIIELSPSLAPFMDDIRNIIPPQRHEIQQLKFQIVDGNQYARKRMIEMHLRIALKIALQRVEVFDMDIEDAISDSCIGLIIAVDKYDPDNSGAFSSYAALWMIQTMSREQSTQRPAVYYPVHIKEGYFSLYPIFKVRSCIGCKKMVSCSKVINFAMGKLKCDREKAIQSLSLMIQDDSFDSILQGCISDDGVILEETLPAKIISALSYNEDDALFDEVEKALLKEQIAHVLCKLTPREEKILKMRYGFGCNEMTLEEIGKNFNLTRERIRQIEVKALKKLKKLSSFIKM